MVYLLTEKEECGDPHLILFSKEVGSSLQASMDGRTKWDVCIRFLGRFWSLGDTAPEVKISSGSVDPSASLSYILMFRSSTLTASSYLAYT